MNASKGRNGWRESAGIARCRYSLVAVFVSTAC